MTCPDFIREALSRFANCHPAGDSFAVPTQCLYPSNGIVTVYLRGTANGCIVSDEGRSIMEIGAHGLEVKNPESFLRQFCHPQGLKVEGRKIFSSAVPVAGLSSAVLLVANASSRAAHWGIHNLKISRRRDLRQEVGNVLLLRFPRDAVKEEGRLSGSSGRQYKFDFVVELGHERKLVVDIAIPEASAINTRAIAHFDLGRSENPSIVQRLVYDETEDWRAEDIALLRMSAELVPFRGFASNISRVGT